MKFARLPIIQSTGWWQPGQRIEPLMSWPHRVWVQNGGLSAGLGGEPGVAPVHQCDQDRKQVAPFRRQPLRSEPELGSHSGDELLVLLG